ncbi:hypothetical protein [Streptomyces sp. NPDC002209]|uniref:hypothetical protein n=1 Tax=Streptomyces sp. NPDC002209 TaxID=3364638 RepID=UPI00368266F8
MISSEQLTQPAVRFFITALHGQNRRAMAGAVSRGFSYMASSVHPKLVEREDSGDIDKFWDTSPLLAVTGQSSDGLALTGLAHWYHGPVEARWEFTVSERVVEGLRITTEVELTSADVREAQAELKRLAEQGEAAEYATVRDRAGHTHLPGTVRRMALGGTYFLHRWGPGAAGGIDWINTGVKLPDAHVYRSLRSPESGEDTCKSTGSKVTSHLELTVGWSEDSYQKASVSFHAKPYFWESVAYLEERFNLVEEVKPRITGTLTLTGPDGVVVSSEKITVKGTRPVYPLSFSREFALAHLPAGSYTLAFAKALKTGGYRTRVDGRETGRTRVRLKDHVLTFTVGA